MPSSSDPRSSRKLVLIHEFAADQNPDFIAEQDDGIYLFRNQPPGLEISRLSDPSGQPEAIAKVALTHVKIEPLELTGSELTYLGERFSPEGKVLGGQVLYRTSLSAPDKYAAVAEFPLGGLHLVAKKGSVRFFERIATGHDVYYEDGFLAWDTERGEVSPKLDRLPEEAVSTLPKYLHSFSKRQGDPTARLGNSEFSLKRLRPGNEASWAIECAFEGGTAKPMTGDQETVSCARLCSDFLIYLRGAAVGFESKDSRNRLVCHAAGAPESPIEAVCGSTQDWRISPGRASLFHVHGRLIAVSTDRLRVFRLE